MPRLPITSLFAAVLALLLFTLAMTVIVTRMTTKTDLGDGDNPLMFRRIRAHGQDDAKYAHTVASAFISLIPDCC